MSKAKEAKERGLIVVVYLFLKSKESMFYEERALLNKLLILVFETM